MTKQPTHGQRTTTKELPWTGQEENYWCGWELGLLARDITLYSDAAPTYKYVFGPHKSPPPHPRNIRCETYNQTHCDKTNKMAQMRSEAGTQVKQQTGPRWARSQTRIFRRQTLFFKNRPTER